MSNKLSTDIVGIVNVRGFKRVSIISKCRLILSVFAVALVLSGCFTQKTSADKMHSVLESVVSAEKGFVDQQEPLVSIEKQEKGIYDQIIGLGMKQYDQIVKLSDEAAALADQRKDHMELESQSLKKSKNIFKAVVNLKDNFDDPTLKKQANELYDLMMKRYEAHDDLYKEYSDGIKYDKELYGMLKNKNLPLEDLEKQVNKVNKTYENIFSANEKFNKLTEQYNSKKKSFYKKAGLIISK